MHSGMASKAGFAAAVLVLLLLAAAAAAPAETLSIEAKNPQPADQPLPGVASIDSADEVDALTQPLPPNSYYTVAFPLSGLSAVGVADGTPGLFWGTIPLSSVAAACDIMMRTGNHTLPVNLKAYAGLINITLDVQQVKGCGDQGPVETTQASFVDSSGRKSVLNCTKEIYTDGCGVFLLGSDVDTFYNAGLQAGISNASNASTAGGSGRKLLQGPTAGAGSSLEAPGRRLQTTAVTYMDEPIGAVSPATAGVSPACSTNGAVESGFGTATSCTAAVLTAGLMSPAGCALGIVKTAVTGTCAGVQGGSSTSSRGSSSIFECFPAHATVQLCRAGAGHAFAPGPWRRMDELELGEEVVVGKAGGGLGCEPIYAWGHHDPETPAWFVRLALSPTSTPASPAAAANTTTMLELTPGHFVPVASPAGRPVYKRAGEVRVGEVLWITAGGVSGGGGSAGPSEQQRLVPAAVVAVSSVGGVGLYNPFTLGGTLVVEGALASAHSDWFADKLFDALGLSAWLPGFYQAVLAPVRLLWHVFGMEAYVSVYNHLDAELDFARPCTGLAGAFAYAYAIVRALAALLVMLKARCSPVVLASMVLSATGSLVPVAAFTWRKAGRVKGKVA